MGESGLREPPARPRAGEVVIWQVSLGAMQPDPSALAPLERERAARFHRETDRHRYVAGRTAVRHILAQYLRVSPGEVPLTAGPHGRPEIPGSLDIGISHAGDLLVLAIASDGRVGVDVEMVDPDLEATSLFTRHLAPSEAAVVAGTPPEDSVRRFLAFWTLKEAVRKAVGEGLRIDTREWPVVIGQDGIARFVDARDRPPGHWHLQSFELGEEVIGAVALTGSAGPRLELTFVSQGTTGQGERAAAGI